MKQHLLAVAHAALDQPQPTFELRRALNTWLCAAKSDIAHPSPFRSPSDREMIIAKMVGEGRATAAEIAAALGLRQSTVEKRIESLALKLPNPENLPPMRLIASWAAVETAA